MKAPSAWVRAPRTLRGPPAPRKASQGAGWVSSYPYLKYASTRAKRIRVLIYPGLLIAYLGGGGTARPMLYLCRMSKSSKRHKRSRGPVDRSATTDVVTQLECAFRNPHAALIGALIGGLVPWFGRTLAHVEIPSAWAAGNTGLALAMLAVVVGCGVFSGLSVYKFGKAAFGDKHKALGFVLALEGVMLVSTGATSGVALAVLILINAVANGSVIALARDATRRRCAADERRAATKARTQAARGYPEQPSADAGPLHTASPAATRRTPHSSPRPASAPRQAVVTPVWRRVSFDDVSDAEIISEEKLLS